MTRLGRVLVLALAWACPVSVAWAEPGEATPDAPEPTPDAPASEATPAEPTITGPTLIDLVHPSGLRVIAAEDDSLPVAAVVLALELGTEDDPASLPGLHHALAYHLQEGNREHAPNGIASLVHDAGGLHGLAVGAAQIRFESIVPHPLLVELVAAETHRLRAPTVEDVRWNDALTWASRDVEQRRAAPREAIAAAFGVPSLAHDGRKVIAELTRLGPRELGHELVQRIGYDRATIVIVADQPPDASIALVERHIADLPPKPRRVNDRNSHAPSPAETARPVPAQHGDGRLFVWPIAIDPVQQAWARVWCRALDQQRPGESEPRRNRMRCRFDPDPRRPIVVVQVQGGEDPQALLHARLDRLGAELEAPLVLEARAYVRRELEHETATPLLLARRLAAAPDQGGGGAAVVRSLHELTGLAALQDAATLPSPTLVLPIGAAIRLVALPEDA